MMYFILKTLQVILTILKSVPNPPERAFNEHYHTILLHYILFIIMDLLYILFIIIYYIYYNLLYILYRLLHRLSTRPYKPSID